MAGSRTAKAVGGALLLALTATSVAALAGPAQAQTPPVIVQVLGTNDFHGRLLLEAPNGGAAVLAGAVEQLSAINPNTVFAAAGDLIGASTFESFIQQDVPTIEVLNEAGLDVSAVGNHEFDQGYADLTERVLPLADWEYLGINVRNAADGSPALPETWIATFGEIEVGFIGAVTDNLPELVAPTGIEGLSIEPEITRANAAADAMKAAGVDVVVLLVHEGAARTDMAAATDPATDFGRIVNGAAPSIDAIVSGHTHLAYSHLIPVPAWEAEPARAVTVRPVVSSGQYGFSLNQLLFSVDPDTEEVVGVTAAILPLLTGATSNYPADPEVAAIVADAVADAATLGATVLGAIEGPFERAKRPTPAGVAVENRGGESTLGNLVAEIQQEATATPELGGAQIAFMNPGGLRADLIGNQPSGEVTYRQAALVQPFANTLVNMSLTGAQIEDVLEQQWQPAGASRPFLRLGISEGFRYTYDPVAPAGARITEMWLDDMLIAPTTTYSVTVNSFLAGGGDNFAAFTAGTGRRDTGQVDLQAAVEYIEAAGTPLVRDFTQRSVGISFPAGPPATYTAGAEVELAVSSLLMPAVPPGGPGTRDDEIAVAIDGVAVGTFPVDNTVPVDTPFDEAGKAAVEFVIPTTVGAGDHDVTITGATTGTTASFPLTTAVGPSVTVLSASAPSQVYGAAAPITFTATANVGTLAATGSVAFTVNGAPAATVPLVGGTATYALPADTPAGTVTVTASYPGIPGVASPSEATTVVVVEQAASTTALTASRPTYRRRTESPPVLTVHISLDNGRVPSGSIELRDGDKLVATTDDVGEPWAFTVPRGVRAGLHTFTATFVPADPANVAGSTDEVTIRVTN